MYVPDGWFKYSRFGTPIRETKIIAIKTPLKQAFNNGRSRGEMLAQHLDHKGGVPTEEEFTPTQLVEQLKAAGWNLKAVIDLTFTSRYYNCKELQDLGVQYSKVFCPGKEIPSDDVYSQFAMSLSDYLASCENNDTVAVHCTHGLNRTGYLVCRYLIDKCQYSAEDAIHAFNEARGYDIERENYLEHLRNGCPPLPPSKKPPNQFHRKGDQGHYHNRDASHSTRGPGYYNHHWPPPPHHQFQREAWGEDQLDGAAVHSIETRSHDRKKKRKNRRSSREPQPNPGPVPLFPDQGPTPIPPFPDQMQPHYDQGDYYRQNSSERDERAHAKHSRRNKRRHNRQQPPYHSPSSIPSRAGSGSSEQDGFTNDASYPVSRHASDCMEPEGLTNSRDSSPWTQAHSRGRAGWQERGRRPMEVGPQGHDWSPSWSHDHEPDDGRYGPSDGYYESYGSSYPRSDRYHWRPS